MISSSLFFLPIKKGGTKWNMVFAVVYKLSRVGKGKKKNPTEKESPLPGLAPKEGLILRLF